MRAPQRVRVQMGAEQVDVLPVWIAVHQHHADGVARCGYPRAKDVYGVYIRPLYR